MLLALEPVFSDLSECPDLSSLPDCSCSDSIWNSNMLSIHCYWSMTDADVDTLVGLIPPTTPMEELAITNSPFVTRVPQGLAQFTSLKGVGLSYNAITSANADDFNNIPALYLVDRSRLFL